MKKLFLVLTILSVNFLLKARTVNVFNPTLGTILVVTNPGNIYTSIPSKETRDINLQSDTNSTAAIFITSGGGNPNPDIPATTCSYTSKDVNGRGYQFQFTNSNRYIVRLDECVENFMGYCVCYTRLEPR